VGEYPYQIQYGRVLIGDGEGARLLIIALERTSQ